MTRRYDEPIDVRLGERDPQSFLWRGRVFLVREVLDRWQERRAWWRETAPEGASALGALAEERERRVWRVEASAGRASRAGVFDLGADGPAGHDRWLLLRAHD